MHSLLHMRLVNIVQLCLAIHLVRGQVINCYNSNITSNSSLPRAMVQYRGCSNEKVDCNTCHTDEYARLCVTADSFCNGKTECRNCFDEADCPSSSFFICEDQIECVRFSNKRTNSSLKTVEHFCDGKPNCNDGSDEKTTGFGFKCSFEIEGKACVIPQNYLTKFVDNQNIALCTNDANKCFKIVNGINIFDPEICWSCLDGTIIQRKQVCNGVFDCPDLSDECLCFRERNSSSICEEFKASSHCSFGEVACPKDGKCIEAWRVCDGGKDCSDGRDEVNCQQTTFEVSNIDSSRSQQNATFSCFYSSKFSDNRVGTPCDGVIDCSHGEDECEARCKNEIEYCQFISRFHTALTIKLANYSECTTDIDRLCNNIIDCPNATDEMFCPRLQKCDEQNASSTSYHSSERCNLVSKCFNNADEMNCSSRTHFYCDNNTHFIPQWLRLDGVCDCADCTDECSIDGNSISSPQMLIKDVVFIISLWILMILSLVGNAVVIVSTSLDLMSYRRSLSTFSNKVGNSNKFLILNLAFSDFLMGIYLLIIVVKTIQFSGHYCLDKFEWLLSDGCTFAGVLAVISSQASILLMVLMTVQRLYAVYDPLRVKILRIHNTYLLTGFIWIVSILLAIIPIFPPLKLQAASGMVLNQPYSGNLMLLSNFNRLFNIARSLPGTNNSIPTPTNLTTRAFCSLFTNSKSVPSFCWGEQLNDVNNIIGYYGSDGVCLPRYYGDHSDPFSGFTLGLISLNFVAFIFMFIVYILIYRITSKLKTDDCSIGSSMDDIRLKENRVMWTRILRLIATDFLCWVPICVMSFLSFSGIALPPIIYHITATILVPINSAANPWLYSSFLKNYMKDQWNSSCFKRFYLQGTVGRRRSVDPSGRIQDHHSGCCPPLERRNSPRDRNIEMLQNAATSCGNNTNSVTTEL